MCNEQEGTLRARVPQAVRGSHHLLVYLMASQQPFCGTLLVVSINRSFLHCRAAVILCCPRADPVSLVVFQHSVLDRQLAGTLLPHRCSAGGELHKAMKRTAAGSVLHLTAALLGVVVC